MYFPEAFLRLIQFDSKEKINIISNNMSCPINKSLAIAISPIFSQAIASNPMIKRISLPINENIKEFFKGQSIEKELFLIMSIMLDNKDLIKQSKALIEINKENVINRLMKFINYKIKIENMKEELEFIGKHFEELEKKMDIKKIPSDYLSEIFKKVKGIQTEKQMFKYIIQRLKEEDDENNRKKLINSIDCRGLNNDDIKELIESLKYEDLSQQLFSIMKGKLLEFDWEEGKIMIKEDKDKNEEILMFILKYQKEKYYKDDPSGFSLLHNAAKNNSKEIGELLIRKGADINVKNINNKNIRYLFLIKLFSYKERRFN